MWCLARLIWSTQVWMKHLSRYHSIIITFPFRLDAVTPDHLRMHAESLGKLQGKFPHPPSCSEMQHVLPRVGRETSAWHPAGTPLPAVGLL